jgi:hypothetical protein
MRLNAPRNSYFSAYKIMRGVLRKLNEGGLVEYA